MKQENEPKKKWIKTVIGIESLINSRTFNFYFRNAFKVIQIHVNGSALQISLITCCCQNQRRRREKTAGLILKK